MLKANKILILFLFVALISSCNSINEIHVSPTGNDAFSGTMDKPFKTIQRAFDALVTRMADMDKGKITVILHDGVYEIARPIIFSDDFPVNDEIRIEWKAAEGAHPIISGAATSNHTSTEDRIEIDFSDSVQPFDLYVNERRATRAKTPNNGFLNFENVEEEVLIQGDGRAPEKAIQTLTFSSDIDDQLSVLTDQELKDVRFQAFFKWDNTIRYLSGKGKEKNSYITEGKGMKPWNKMKPGTRFFLENYESALDTAGEWITNSTQENQKLIYIPRETEKGNEISITIPVVEKLLVIRGTPNRIIKNITFEGISFQYSNYPLPKSGFEPAQAAATIGAAIEIDHAESISFKNCEIAHTGQHAVWFRKGVQNCEMDQCHIHDLGAGGVRIGERAIPMDSLDATGNIQIENCIIQSGGYNFPSAVGVWIGQSGNNTVSHNDIADFRYTGVSVGWVWGYADSPAKNNKIKFNHIHHIGWALLSDMAGVYTLGQSEGTEVSNNVVHDIQAFSYGGWGLYTDEGSSYIKMENNLVYNTKTGGFHQHYGRENSIRNNILAYAQMYQAQATRVEDHLSFIFQNNIIMGDEGVVLAGRWQEIKIKMDHNCYWMKDSTGYDFAGLRFDQWQKEIGHDQNSIVANPGSVDRDNGTYSLQEGIAEKIGFSIFDPTEAGVYGDMAWQERAKLPAETVNEFKKIVEINKKENNLRQ